MSELTLVDCLKEIENRRYWTKEDRRKALHEFWQSYFSELAKQQAEYIIKSLR